MNFRIKGRLKMSRQNICYRAGMNAVVQLLSFLNISAQLSDPRGRTLNTSSKLSPSQRFTPIPHHTQTPLDNSYPLSPLLLLLSSLRVIYGPWMICGHQEEWGNMSMNTLCPRWPLLQCNLPHLGLDIPCGIRCEVHDPAQPRMARTL